MTSLPAILLRAKIPARSYTAVDLRRTIELAHLSLLYALKNACYTGQKLSGWQREFTMDFTTDEGEKND